MTDEEQLYKWAQTALDTFNWRVRPVLSREEWRDGLSTRYIRGLGALPDRAVCVEVCLWLSSVLPDIRVKGPALVDIRMGYDGISTNFVHRVEIDENGCAKEPHPELRHEAFHVHAPERGPSEEGRHDMTTKMKEDNLEVFRRNNIVYASDGQPMASIHFVIPHLLKFDHPHFKKKKVKKSVVNKMRKIAQAIAPILKDDIPCDDRSLLDILKPHEEFILELDDEELCALFNEAIDGTKEFIGYNCAFFIFYTLQRLDDKFGTGIFGPHYTYNDPDGYCGHRDIQFCYPGGKGDSIYGCDGCDLIFVQIHPGGDARNMASGYFYMAEGIDEMTNLFDTLGASHAGELCTTVEIPAEFPLEQWIQKVDDDAWESMYREEVKGDDGRYAPKDTLYFHDFKDGMCRTQFSPKGDNGAGVAVYRCFDVACYKGRDFWTWVPEGEIVGEMHKQWGVSATPWKPEEFKYSTGGYFKWEGPMPGTDAWSEMMKENGLDPIEPRQAPPKQESMFEEEE